MSERCSVCNKLFADLPEGGCDQCGVEYDPLQPDFNEELDFNKETVPQYEEDFGTNYDLAADPSLPLGWEEDYD